MSAPTRDAPFLASDPPPLAANGLAWILIALFVTVSIGAVAVKLPEVVTGAFVLVPVQGADPIRTPREGVVIAVSAREGAQVPRGATLFTIRSEPVGDRSATLRSLQGQLAGADQQEANARRQYESARRADEDEIARLNGKLASLERIIPLRRSQAAAAATLDSIGRIGRDRGVISGDESATRRSDADRLAIDLANAEADEAETRTAITTLRDQIDMRSAQHAEAIRQQEAARADARIRIAALGADTSNWSSGLLTIRAPCDGTVLRLHISAVGAVVQPGDALSEMTCAGAPLRAEMRVPENGMALLRAGQRARLRYDAYPYQRFGARDGVVRWVGPASVRPDSAGFRALIDPDTAAFVTSGGRAPLMPGMAGRVDVVVGRRALVGYIFEPLRQLRENVGQGH